MSDLSGEPCGVVLEVYEDRGALSRARSMICLAAAAILADVFALVVGPLAAGGKGNGGGARSGSELSHLRLIFVSRCISLPYFHPRVSGPQYESLSGHTKQRTHMGTLIRPLSEKEC